MAIDISPQLLRMLEEYGALSVADLFTRLSWEPAAIANAFERLLESRYVEIDGDRESLRSLLSRIRELKGLPLEDAQAQLFSFLKENPSMDKTLVVLSATGFRKSSRAPS